MSGQIPHYRILVVAIGIALGVGGTVLAKTAGSPVLSASAKRGLAIATQRCSGCHAVTTGRGSPNPESPPFEAVANQQGLTGTTLRQFLRDSHNYPAAMNFKIERGAINDLADYIVTLKSRTYRPGI